MNASVRTSKSHSPATISPPISTPKTKQALVIEMLRCKEGATLATLVEATGWLPHSIRSALTGLRKKGHVIIASREDGARVFRIRKTV